MDPQPHNNQLFSELPKALINDEGLFFGKKTTLVYDSSPPHPVNVEATAYKKIYS
jgi:hypothetical protein